jgi:hypothetical protein
MNSVGARNRGGDEVRLFRLAACRISNEGLDLAQ